MKISAKKARLLGITVPKKKAKEFIGKAPTKRVKTDDLFDALCLSHGLPKPQHEVEHWHPNRAWRFDYLFEGWVAVERVGGVWGTGAKCGQCGQRQMGHHSRGQTQIDDMERQNQAQIMGFVLLQFVPSQFDDGSAFPVIHEALYGKARRR